MLTFLYVGAAIGAASLALTESGISDPLRAWLKPRNTFLYRLFSCPFCMSHWLAAAFLTTAQTPVVADLPVIHAWLVSWLVLVVVASVTAFGIARLAQ